MIWYAKSPEKTYNTIFGDINVKEHILLRRIRK